jgi:hypothetical protein
MIRTTAQVAKILNVDSQQLKQWAFEFKDYLSASANPSKGNMRRFQDSDLLALMYIQHYWEDDPDVECIQIGLNRGEQYEEAFLEHLYMHTPLIQEPPDGLDESWRHGILLVGSGRYEFVELARNYRCFAETMLKSALEKDEMERSAYPVLFAFRHALELYLKLIGDIDEITHSLKRCLELVEKRHREKFPSPIREWILELDGIDPRGTAFRYANEDTPLNQHYEQWFDFQHFEFAMKVVFDTIENAIRQTNPKSTLRKKK